MRSTFEAGQIDGRRNGRFGTPCPAIDAPFVMRVTGTIRESTRSSDACIVAIDADDQDRVVRGGAGLHGDSRADWQRSLVAPIRTCGGTG